MKVKVSALLRRGLNGNIVIKDENSSRSHIQSELHDDINYGNDHYKGNNQTYDNGDIFDKNFLKKIELEENTETSILTTI